MRLTDTLPFQERGSEVRGMGAAARQGELVSVKARLELKAVERGTGRVVAADRQTTVVVDLAEAIAGKTALQEAAGEILERLLPKIVKPAGDKAK